MIKIVGADTIEISRGDYGTFRVIVDGVDDGEKVVFSVMKSTAAGKPLIVKEMAVEDGQATVELLHADTARMETGDYIWDVCLPDFFFEGEPHTPVTPRKFRILGVSHDV